MYCSLCGDTFIAWDQRMLNQLSDGQRPKFPAVLRRKYTCDRSLLRARTLGNSSTAVANNVHKLHTNEWLLRHTAYCERHKKGLESFNLPIPEAPLPPKFLTPRWFALLCSSETSWNECMSSWLQQHLCMRQFWRLTLGAAANTATNVGNKKGEIVVSVLTSSEDLSCH